MLLYYWYTWQFNQSRSCEHVGLLVQRGLGGTQSDRNLLSLVLLHPNWRTDSLKRNFYKINRRNSSTLPPPSTPYQSGPRFLLNLILQLSLDVPPSPHSFRLHLGRLFLFGLGFYCRLSFQSKANNRSDRDRERISVESSHQLTAPPCDDHDASIFCLLLFLHVVSDVGSVTFILLSPPGRYAMSFDLYTPACDRNQTWTTFLLVDGGRDSRWVNHFLLPF